MELTGLHRVGDRVTRADKRRLAPGERDAGGTVLAVEIVPASVFAAEHQVCQVRWDATRALPEIVTVLEAEHLVPLVVAAGPESARRARNITAIRNELDALIVAYPKIDHEPVRGDGWYLNSDGTFTEQRWVNGRLKTGPTVRAEDCERFDRVMEEWLEVFDRQTRAHEVWEDWHEKRGR